MRWTILAVLLLGSQHACAADPLRRGDPSAEGAVSVRAAVGDTVRLRPGQVAEVGGADGLRILFTGISADSRCPVGVDCVWSGDATARLAFAMGGAWTHTELHTHLEPMETRAGGFTIVLVGVEPYPRSGAAIRADRYVAVLRVDRP